MTQYESYVCSIFHVNSVSAINKSDMVRAVVNLSLMCESLNMDLFQVKPDHDRFAKIPPAQRAAMTAESLRRTAQEAQAKKTAEVVAARSKELAETGKEPDVVPS